MSSAIVDLKSGEGVQQQIMDPTSSKMPPNSKNVDNETNRGYLVDDTKEETIANSDAKLNVSDSTLLGDPEDEGFATSKGKFLLIFT